MYSEWRESSFELEIDLEATITAITTIDVLDEEAF